MFSSSNITLSWATLYNDIFRKRERLTGPQSLLFQAGNITFCPEDFAPAPESNIWAQFPSKGDSVGSPSKTRLPDSGDTNTMQSKKPITALRHRNESRMERPPDRKYFTKKYLLILDSILEKYSAFRIK